nr:hypothetical protein [Tanacetum cinerariifolium]
MLRCMMDRLLLKQFKGELQCKESKRARDSQWYHDKALLMQAKEKGAVLHAEAKAFLADVKYEYQNDSEVEAVPTVVSADEVDKQSMIAILQRMHTEIAGYVRVNDEHKLVNATLTAELKRCKIEMQALECNKVKHDLDMAIVERNKRNAELEEENAMLKSTLKSKAVSIENLQQESKQVLFEKKTLEDKYLEEIVVLTNANKVATNVLKGFQMPTHTIPMLLKRPNFASHDLYKTGLEVKEFERIFDELDAEYERILLEKKNMQIEKKNILRTNECLIANSIANDICSIVLAYDLVVPPSSDSSYCMLEELRTTCDREHSKALETELTQLKDNVTSLKIQNDGETPIPLPKKKQVTFPKTPKPSPRFTKKPIAPLLKKPNVNVPLSIGIKYATGASKPASKSTAWIYMKLLAKSAKGEKVEEHIRNLNKNNRVDSHVKGSVSIKNLTLFVAKNTMRTTKNVWRPKVVTSVKPMWKPTRRHFTLYDSYPLTRILEPTVELIELSPIVSSSTKISMLSVFVAVTLGMV